jgi:hypothetical protein
VSGPCPLSREPACLHSTLLLAVGWMSWMRCLSDEPWWRAPHPPPSVSTASQVGRTVEPY